MTDVFGGNGRYIYDDLDVNNHKIINCLDPENDQDVATKHYVDSRRSETSWNTDGNTLGALGKIGSVNDLDFEVVRNNLVKMQFTNTAINMNSNVYMGGNRITDVSDPNDAQDVATKHYVDTQTVIGNYVHRAGDTMTGNLTFDGTNRSVNLLATNIQGVNSFTIGTDLSTCNIHFNMALSPSCTFTANDFQFNTGDNALLGHWITGIFNVLTNISLNNNIIGDVQDPYHPQDVATKNYVDTQTVNGNFVHKIWRYNDW